MAQNSFLVSGEAQTSGPRAGRSIGAILVDAGRLSVEDAERVLRLQREQNLRFGDAAIKLGVLTEADIDLALSHQFDYPYLLRGSSKVSERVVAAYQPTSPEVEAMRALRSQLMLRWFDGSSQKTLAIVSAGANEGRSFIASNLAVVFSQLGERTLLIDADMRSPSQHELFGLENRTGLSAVLAGRGPAEVQRVEGLRDLSVLTAGPVPPNSIELLSRPLFGQTLTEFGAAYDVILLDTPSASLYADAQTVAARAGGALLVARKNASRAWHVRALSDAVAQANAALVGTVLNDF